MCLNAHCVHQEDLVTVLGEIFLVSVHLKKGYVQVYKVTVILRVKMGHVKTTIVFATLDILDNIVKSTICCAIMKYATIMELARL